MLIVLILGLSTFFGSLPAAQAGDMPSEIRSIDSQVENEALVASEFQTPDSLENQVPAIETDIMTPAEVKAELDQLYHKDTKSNPQLTSTLESIEPEFMSSSSYTGQLIVKFSSFGARDLFVSSIASGVSFRCLQTLPYIVVPKTSAVFELLVASQGIAQISDDRLLATPEYQIYENEDFENELSMFNSEGRIGTWDMHSLGYTGKGIKIAVLDTGIDSTHPDLMYNRDGSTKIIAQQSFVDVDFDGIPDESPEDLIGHGTHVAGTAAGNGYQIGVAPDAYLLNAKVCSGTGCATSWMIEAVEWAILNEADIITLSIGGSTFWGLDALDDILDYAWQQGIVVTIAAGNDGPVTSSVQTPGTGPRVITVAATDSYDLITAFSGRGPSVYGHYDPDIAAPGDPIFSTFPGNTYAILGGTSMATPHVAGAVALLLEAHPEANPDMVKANIMANGKDIGFPTNVQGAGLLDLVATHNAWTTRRAILFPTFNDQDILYLSPGETFSGYFSYINSRRDGIQPLFKLDRSDAFDIQIYRESIFPDMWREFFCRPSSFGQQFIPFTVTAPSNAEPGTQLSRDITAYFLKGIQWPWRGENPLKTKMVLTIEVVQIEDDAFTGTDVSDTFPGATEIPFGNYSGQLSDIDFYKVWLEAEHAYTFVLDGFDDPVDYDLAIYNETGQLVTYGGLVGSEHVLLTTETAGYYILRVDPWSLYIDPWLNRDTAGPYNLWMIEGETPANGGGGSGVQVEYLGAEMSGIDFDSDSINDYMAVTVTLNVIVPGLVDIYTWIALDKSPEHEKWVYGLAFIEGYDLTEPGVLEITMLLDGTNVADQNFVGSHVIYELFVGDPLTFNTLVDLYELYTSPTFDSADFGTPHLQYHSYYTDTYDEDGDGIPDWLTVDVTVEISETFDWVSYFTCTLYHPDGYFFWSYFDEMLDLSVPGLQVLHFLFNPDDFVNAPSGILDLELVVIYSWYHPMSFEPLHFDSLPYILTIGAPVSVNLVDFSAVGLTEIVSIVDYGLDTDGDTRFDYLVFDVNVYIGTPGYYSAVLHPWLWSIPDQAVTTASDGGINDIIWYESGYYTIEIRLSGEILNGAGNDGPFLVLYIWLESYDFSPGGIEFLGDSAEVQNYETNSYSTSDFDVSGAKFIQVTGLNYVDFDFDGEAESIEVLMEFDIAYTGTLDFIIEFVSYPIDNLLVTAVITSFYFDTVGLQIVPMILDGLELFKQEYQGQLDIRFIDVARYDPDLNGVFYHEYNGLIDVDYTLLPGAAPAASIYSVDDFGIDANSNGMFEYLDVSITIDVEKPREFILYLDIFGDASTGWWSYVGSYYTYFTAWEPDFVTIEFLIPASDILNSVFDEYTSFELWITLIDTSTETQLDFEGPIYTNWYYIPDFEVPWMYSVGYYTYDADGDFCDDTIVILADFTFFSLNDVTVDLYLDVWFYDETDGYFYIETLYDGFSVVENPSYFGTFFTWQAIMDGIFVFQLGVYIDGEFVSSDLVYWYFACAYNP